MSRGPVVAVEVRVSSRDPGQILAEGVAAGVFCGAAACAADLSGARERFAVGTVARGSRVEVTAETLFDIASLTKPFTASAALRLVATGDLALDATLSGLLPRFAGTRPGRATVEQLLSHEAGFAAWAPFFEAVSSDDRNTVRGREAVLDMIAAGPFARDAGARAEYSDLGYIVLGEALRRLRGVQLRELIAGTVTGPLGLRSVGFGPVDEEAVARRGVAATEDCPWRGRVLSGEVHDDNAWAMGGEEGHAGLFADADDVARLGLAWLDALRVGGWLPRSLAERAVARRPSGRALCWDIKSEKGSMAGELTGPRTFGHLGFTGCSLWVDPDAGVAVSMLTNRVHPTRHGKGIELVRPRFHDAVFRRCC